MNKLLLALLLSNPFAAAQSAAPCGPVSVSEPLTSHDLDAERRIKLLDEIFSLIRQEHYDPTFGGVDLDDLRQRYEPQVLAAEDDGEIYQLLDHMADEVSSIILPPQANSSAGTGFSGIGVTINREPSENVLEVTGVFPSGPAEAAGLKRGDLILAVDGDPSCPGPSNILGEPGTPVTLTIQSPGGQEREVTVTRAFIQPRVIVESYRLPDYPDIGYLWVPDFLQNDILRSLTSALNNLGIRRQDPDLPAGLILDLRGVSRCWDDQLRVAMMPLFSGLLYYYVAAPDASADEVIPAPSVTETPSNALVRQIPLVLLVDDGTGNCFEALAGKLQAEGRALLVGVPTAGNTLRGREQPLLSYGAALWVPNSEEVLPDGTSLLGTGVVPDVRVDVQDVPPYVPGGEADPFVQAAVQALQAGAQ